MRGEHHGGFDPWCWDDEPLAGSLAMPFCNKPELDRKGIVDSRAAGLEMPSVDDLERKC